MKIGIVNKKNVEKWGGAWLVLDRLYTNLQHIGQDVIMGGSVAEVLEADFILLCGTIFDLKEDCEKIRSMRKRSGVLAFHEDYANYFSVGWGFTYFVGICLGGTEESIPLFTLDQLLEDPDIVIHFTSFKLRPYLEHNYLLMEDMQLCIANTPSEVAIIRRDSPNAHIKTIFLDCGIQDIDIYEEDPCFLEFTGLKKGEYVLQIGRMEMRKNQLGSILAMRDLDMPLVFIATECYFIPYTIKCLRIIEKYRRAPTLIISQHLEPMQKGNLRIIKMPNGEKLSQHMLMSAYKNAGLYLHPAFHELPGLIYLEAAKLGIPSVASKWTSIRDYFIDPITQEYTMDDRIAYCTPHHIDEITDKIKQQFGKKINKAFIHPILKKTGIDVAREFALAIQEAML